MQGAGEREVGSRENESELSGAQGGGMWGMREGGRRGVWKRKSEKLYRGCSSETDVGRRALSLAKRSRSESGEVEEPGVGVGVGFGVVVPGGSGGSPAICSAGCWMRDEGCEMRELKLSGVKLFAWCVPSTPTAFTVYADARHRRGETVVGGGDGRLSSGRPYQEYWRRIGTGLARDWHSALMP